MLQRAGPTASLLIRSWGSETPHCCSLCRACLHPASSSAPQLPSRWPNLVTAVQGVTVTAQLHNKACQQRLVPSTGTKLHPLPAWLLWGGCLLHHRHLCQPASRRTLHLYLSSDSYAAVACSLRTWFLSSVLVTNWFRAGGTFRRMLSTRRWRWMRTYLGHFTKRCTSRLGGGAEPSPASRDKAKCRFGLLGCGGDGEGRESC